jgi:hypothetical protein
MTDLKRADEALDDVFASGRDRGADSAASEPEVLKDTAKAEAPPIDDKAKAELPPDAEEGSSKQYRDPETGRFVPLTELKSERAKRQEFEKRATEAEQRALRAEAQAEEARRFWQSQQQQQIQQPQQQQPPKQLPDPWTDPEGYTKAMLQEVEQKFARQEFQNRVAMSERFMRSQHPDFDQVVEVFGKAAQSNRYLLDQMTQHAMPAEYAYQMGKRLLLADRIGNDPDSYEKRIREEERQKTIAELKAGPAQTQRFPGTLADAPASGSQGKMLTDEAMLGDVFSSDRRVKRR